MNWKKIIALIEVVGIVLILALHIVPHWDNKYTTPGDIFCMEILGLLSYNIYDNLKKKVN